MRTLHISLRTEGNTDVLDLTPRLQELIRQEKINDAVMVLSVLGSTAALTTMEFEPGLVKDLKEMFEKLMPYDKRYAHNATWNDDNGHSHLRSLFLKTGLTLSITRGALDLGTWQQVVLLDFDTRARDRDIVVKILE